MVSNRQKKKRLVMRTFAMMFFMALFTQIAQAQNVYMHGGTQTVPATGSLDFYDSGGPSSADFCWEKWYSHNENATLTFKKDASTPVVVTFNQFTAYDGNSGNHATPLNGSFSLRINDDHLYVYEGEKEDASKLIVDLTGTIVEPFSIMANGPITFKFVSNGSYRDEGWAAQVSAASSYAMQKPIIVKEICDDEVVLYPTAPGATIYYTTNGSTPTTSSTEYMGPFSIDLSGNVTVKAIVVKDGQNNSAVATHTFTPADQRPTPTTPTISINGNMVHITPGTVPAGLNETYNVRYTADGTEPSATNGTLITSPWDAFEWHTPNTTFKAVSVAVTCSDKVSSVETANFGNVTVPTPVITFNADGTATITCSLVGASIFYTLDGSTPTTSSGDFGTTSVTTAALTPGATVKAIAHYESQGYVDSQVASNTYVPSGGSTVGGGIVLLDDREDHSWSYYSDDSSPIKSLNPADVKITYFGNGTGNMTTAAQSGDNPTAFGANATGVQVNIGETENQFIYLKTLEKDGNSYPYTMIPNPFQVRPMGESGTVQSPTRTLYISGTVNGSNNQRFIRVTYTDENNQQQTWQQTSSGSGNTTITVKAGTSITLTARGRSGNNWSGYSYSTITARYDDSSTATIGTVTANSSNYNTSPYAQGTYTTSTATITVPGYRGFYAWRVKRLGGGLSIQRANGTAVNVGGIINAEEDIKFVTSNEEGNEVDFEALWAQAYVAVGSLSGLNSSVSYERNFMIIDGAGYHATSGVSVPVTITSVYPNGTSDGSTPTTTVPSSYYWFDDFSAANHTKFENIVLRNAYMDNNNLVEGNAYYYSNGYDLVFGRGIQSYDSNGSVGQIQAYGYSSSAHAAFDYHLRLESGEIVSLAPMGAGYVYNNTNYPCTISGTPHVNVTLGSDYDRAKKNNGLFSVTGAFFGGRYVVFSSSANATAINYDYTMKSGNILTGDVGSGAQGESMYLGVIPNVCQYQGGRRLTVEGGVINNIAGGLDQDSYASTTNENVYIRIKGGQVDGCVYGAAAYVTATGNRKFVITGGTINGWIAGGCNGTASTGGETYGDSYIYFGGDAQVGNSEGGTHVGGEIALDSDGDNVIDSYGINGADGGIIFGAGCGINPTDSSFVPDGSYTTNTVGQVNNSTVVVADNAIVWRDIYGGGNYGYIANSGTANLHIIGGEVKGNVYGGANNQKSQTVNISMTNGVVEGNIYGGSNSWGIANGLASINVSGGKVSNVFGGGYGSGTDMQGGTKVNIAGGTINNNVYGGGEQGTVSNGGTEVNVSGGTMKDVYGAGKGASSITALVSGQTKVTISGGTISGDVFGGGQNGNVVYAGGSSSNDNYSYNFDDGTLQGWTTIQVNTSGGNWLHSNNNPGNYDYTSLAHSGTGFAMSYSFIDNVSAYNTNAYLVSPRQYEVRDGATLSFWYDYANDTYQDYFEVCVSTAATPSSASDFTAIWTSSSKGNATPNDVLRHNNNRYNNWREIELNLSSYAGQNIWIAFHHQDEDQYEVWIDDITISIPSDDAEVVPASLVSVSGGAISGSVFGGGKMGTTTGAVTTTVSGGNIRGNVFGGAEGEQKKVFVTGLRTVNMTGGQVYGNVYGGSRNANDGNDLNLAHNSFSSSTETGTICVTNISGGSIDQNVYAAGYYGNTFGSVYAFIGKNAIENAPNKRPTSDANYAVSNLNILGTVWAGGDWGTFSGSFGGSTISGNSNIYIDGLDYQTTTNQTSNAQYMNIGGSVLASGTSCDAGKGERTVIIRNYGTANNNGGKDEPYIDATRSLLSIQRAKLLIIDNANLNLNGQGMINSLNATEKYGIYEIGNGAVTEDMQYGVRLVNGSGLFLNAPVSQIANFVSCSCDDVYTAELTTDDYPALTPSDLSTTDNKVRVNGGNYVEVKYDTQYGMLSGYAHMMVSTAETDATCAYARPRWESNAPFNMNDSNYDNRNDGGWVSYTASNNTFDLAGNSGNIQMPYENHTHSSKNGEQYFRIWRAGGIEHYREGVFNAHATGSDTYKTVDVTITLPALRNSGYVYRFETVGTGSNTSISYGADIMAYDAARATGSGDDWISYTTSQQSGQTQAQVQQLLNDGILANPDVNFGLVVMPTSGLGLTGDTYLISQNADENLALASTQFTNADFTKEDQITFRLTYYDKLSSNMTWDPMTIVLVQVDPDHPDVVLDRVTISLAVNTSTTITQEFSTTLYAVMQGKGSNAESYTAKVTLPHFTVESGHESTFTVNSVSFSSNHIDATNEDGLLVNRGGTYTRTNFAVTYGASNNYDNTNGWASNTGQNHDANQTTNVEIGKTGGRNEFAIDFTLHYNGHESITTTDTLGVLTFNITFDYFVAENDETQMNQPMTILVYVIRRGGGTKFYLDGINGSNNFDGKHPDQAALSLSTIFNRLGYLAGDEIYIVNKVTIDKQLTWNGSTYDNVLIYRYDGGHELATSTGIIGNPDNEAYLDTLVYVTHNLVMTGITLDGHYNGGNTQIQVGVDNENNPVYAPFTPVTAESPMIVIANGATVELNDGTVLRQNNNNTSDGGAVYIADGGTLMMNADATITNNVSVGDGAGVYMDGTLNVSDDVVIYDNIGKGVQNNVYLTDPDKVVTIGTGSTTDAYGALSSSAQIGVTKTTSSEYTKVVHVDSENDIAWLETPYPRPNTVIFHDDGIYELEYYEDPTYLYWVGTWVTTVTWNPYFTSREQTGYTDYMTAAQLQDIHTPQQLAWVISMLNGENHCVAGENSNANIKVTADIDMYASIWVPMGTTAHPFTGTFDGNGFTIEGIHSTLVHQDMGMFGNTAGTVSNAVIKVDFDANSANIGTVAGTVSGGTISNVEAAGTLTGGSNTVNIGGIAGVTASGSEIHSSFAVNTMSSIATTVMGGLVGTNGGDLINSYANTAMSVSEHIGGLAGDNTGRIENCYSVVGIKNFPSFAYNNSGTITYCYADKAGNYVTAGQTEPTKSGNYSAVLGRKEYGYMYGDNIVTATGNDYVKTTHAYDNNHIVKWDGLLSVLNQWVNDGHTAYTKWFRPTTQNVNGDLPVLGFPKNICMATENSNKKFLDYSNNLDHLLEGYGGKTASIFLYGNATNVANVPGTNLYVYVNEDAALIQSGTGDFKNTTVGVTFDNSSDGTGTTWNQLEGTQTLTYDWHFLSSPLQNAPLGIVYTDEAEHHWWGPYGDNAQVESVSGSYLPDGIESATKPG
ncbi:MAG: chitobiase/beta-hexosaminidase C-terminal domain-containing protein, partial [Bacteroidales bacterium]|nr:chitobiase/beta-hexosaminidase C-terminal domain-containing protein [Bacteroidales bacterium]